jgi:SAM-dependent methyltransferase
MVRGIAELYISARRKVVALGGRVDGAYVQTEVIVNKPKHLGLTYAEQFKEQSVVSAYAYRPPIPDAVFDLLAQLIVDEPRVLLDAGCGTGAVARRAVTFAERVDAVDFSRAMLEAGRHLPNGDHPRLRWIEGSLEQVTLTPPYALIIASESLHWMDWDIVMPRFRAALTSNGVVAIVRLSELPHPWTGALGKLFSAYSTNQDYQPYDLVEESTNRGLFRVRGEQQTPPVSFPQSIEDYVEAIHSRNGFSRERMTVGAAQAFDYAVTSLVLANHPDGIVELEVSGHVVWGEPAPL